MGIGDILKGVGGAASLIPGVGTVVGSGLGFIGSLLGNGDEEEKKKQEQKAAEEAAIKAKQAGNSATPSGDTPITNPNMAILGQQLQQQQQQMQPGGMPTNMNGLLNNRRNNGY